MTIDPPVIVVVGSGSLARAVCVSLAIDADDPVAIAVVARNTTAAADVCYVTGIRARLAGRPVAAWPVELPPVEGYGSDSEQADADRLEGVLAALHPRGVVICASYQSPWERLTAPSAWTDLLARAGFGLCLPLQAALPTRVARAAAAMCPDAWVVNACFPDAVNPLLADLGVPVLCGIGNVGLLATALQAALDLPDQTRLRLLAHHVHLQRPERDDYEARAWLDHTLVPEVTALLAPLRSVSRPALNEVTGVAAAALVRTLLSRHDLDTHLPGPLGLPGGYPVRVRAGDLSLRLPDGVGLDEAIASNQRAAVRDGVMVAHRYVTFGPSAVAELDRVLPELSSGFPVDALPDACRLLVDLRARLRNALSADQLLGTNRRSSDL